MTTTPTPRTDAEWQSITVSAPWDAAAEQMAQHARQLERELADKTESLAFQTQLNREVIEREKQTHAELAAEREQVAVWKHEARRLEAELETFDEAAIVWWCEYQDLKAKARQTDDQAGDPA